MNIATLFHNLFYRRFPIWAPEVPGATRRYGCLKTCALSGAWIWLLSTNTSLADQLFWHQVRLDDQGKLLSWVDSGAPYDQILRTNWAMFESIPVQSDGYRTYFTYPEFNGLNDPAQPLFTGRPWAHNPAGLFAMLTDSAILYHAYSGDPLPWIASAKCWAICLRMGPLTQPIHGR